MADITINWTRQDNNPNGSFEVYRSTDGSLGTQLASGLSLSTDSYTDTGRSDGVEYWYTIRRVAPDTTADAQISVSTDLSPPTGNSIDAERDTELDQSWTLQSTDEDGVRVYRRESGGSFTEVADLAAGSESYTHTGLLNGQQYDVFAAAYTADTESESGTAISSTTLPDEDQPALGNGVEDEVAVDRQTAVSNNGSVRIQIRETGESSWESSATGFSETVSAFDTLTVAFTGREDGEEYEVRARTETDDVTGAWTEPVAIVTTFPGATALSATSVSTTEVELSWTDNADNEDGQLVVRERRFADGSYPSERVLDDAGPNTESFTDDTAQPATTYRYRVRAYTDDAEADSNTDTAATDDIGLSPQRVPATGPYVEVDTPDQAAPLTPTVVDVDWSPNVNTLPTVGVTVPRSDRWSDLTGESMRVWIDGTQLPIDTLEGTSQTPEGTTLEGTGGKELDQYTDDIQIDEQEIHLAARELIDEYTGYARNVDDPATDTRSDVLMLSATSPSAIEDALLNPPGATDTWTVSEIDGAVQRQVGWFREIEDVTYDGDERFAASDEEWSGGAAVRFQELGESFEFTFESDHEIPAGECEFSFLRAAVGGHPGFNLQLDDTIADSVPADALTTQTDRYDLTWGPSLVLNPGEPVAPGTHTVEVNFDENGSGDLFVDAAHVRDDRESFTFDETPVDGVIQGPEEHPAETDVVFDDVASVEQVIAGDLEASLSSTEGTQAVAISNDQGANWIEATNTETVSGTFAEPSQQIRARVTLSRYSGDSSTSPAQGDTPQSLSEVELRADLEDTPVLLDKQYRDRLSAVLSKMADDGNMVWELRRDPDADPADPSGMVVEWTQIGQRTRESTASATDFEVRTTIEDAYERVVVFGRSRQVDGSEFAAPSSDQVEGLGNEWVVPDSERIYDPETDTEFERGADYRIQWDLGGIELLDGSNMTSGETYVADYEYRYRGEATRPDVNASEARTIERQIPGATSKRECNQLALGILKDVQDAQVEATLDVTLDDPSVPLVEALSHPRLPGGVHLLRGVESTEGGRRYRLANRRTAGEVFDAVREDYDALADAI